MYNKTDFHSQVAATGSLDSLTEGPDRDLETFGQVVELCVRLWTTSEFCDALASIVKTVKLP